MEVTPIISLRDKIDQTVKIQGWLTVLRDQKKMQFLVVRDRTAAVQVAFWKGGDAALAEKISTITTESALTITGKVVDAPQVKLNGLEIQLESITIENLAEAPLPFEPFGDTVPAQDFRMDWRYLDLRRPENLLIFKVQTVVENAIREFSSTNNFMEIHSPKIMGSPSESGAELFEIQYFDRKAYLAQSPQFFKQMAMAAGFEKVVEIGPVFRADPSFTSRHMTEFTGLDMEISWVESHEDVMRLLENLLAHIYLRVKENLGEEIKTVFGKEIVVPTVPFPRVTMSEAYRILKEKGYQLPPEKKGDLDPGGERALGAHIKELYGHDFVYVTDWPIAVRPFYHMRYEDNPELTKSFDLIASGLEITTGAQREHRVDVLAKQALEKGLHLEPIQFYLDFFKYGCPPHGGYGLGLSRLLMVLLDLQNIRDAVFLFRGPNRLNP